MADPTTSLPVRTATNGDVVAQLVDGTILTQKLTIDSAGRITSKTTDGTGTGITSTPYSIKQGLDINILNTSVPVSTALDINPATQSITAQDVSSTSSTGYGGQIIVAGSATSGSTASFVLSSNESVMLQVTGIWTGTLTSEVSIDAGVTWVPHSIHLIGSPIFSSTFTANVNGSLNVAAKTNFRVRATSAWTGTATVKVIESDNASTIYVANAIKLVDGSSPTSGVTATIKAASTPAAATDTSIVVAFSPNSGLPTGSSVIGSVTQSGGPWTQNLTQVGGVALALGQTTMSASVPVTFASNQSTLPVKDLSDGPVAPGTAAANSILIGVQFSTSLPTFTNGQQGAAQSDGNGRLLIGSIASSLPAGAAVIGGVTQSGGPWTQNLTQINSATPSATNSLPSQITLGAAFVSESNPFPVELSVAGTPVNDYKDATSIGAGASDTHTYIVTAGKTLHLSQVEFSAIGSAKFTLQVETGVATGVFTVANFTKFVSSANNNASIVLNAPVAGAAGVRVQVVALNKETLLSQDLYSTICGHEE